MQFDGLEEKLPDTLKDFFRTAHRLSSDFERAASPQPQLELNNCEKKHMSAKKQHEVVLMSSYVNTQCERTRCDVVVDVGSGLVGELK